MKVEEIDGELHVWLRQSWINDVGLCHERGRLAIVDPTWQMQGDSACMGTATHAGIEAYLNGRDPHGAVVASWDEMLSKPMRMTLGMAPGAMKEESARMYEVWLREIEPLVIDNWTDTEMYFNVDWYTQRVGERWVHVHLSGTVDLVCTHSLWDWKTSGRKYSQNEKQSKAIQPTVYSIAAVKLGLLEYPIRFNYGVMLRGKDDHQVVPVIRTINHEAWLTRIVSPLVRQAVVLGFEEPWTANDDHNLCSEKWCPWWARCKGHSLTHSDLNPGGTL